MKAKSLAKLGIDTYRIQCALKGKALDASIVLFWTEYTWNKIDNLYVVFDWAIVQYQVCSCITQGIAIAWISHINVPSQTAGCVS